MVKINHFEIRNEIENGRVRFNIYEFGSNLTGFWSLAAAIRCAVNMDNLSLL